MPKNEHAFSFNTVSELFWEHIRLDNPDTTLCWEQIKCAYIMRCHLLKSEVTDYPCGAFTTLNISVLDGLCVFVLQATLS